MNAVAKEHGAIERPDEDKATSLDLRRRFIDPNAYVDDMAVLFGLVVAGRVAPEVMQQAVCKDAAAVRRQIDEIVGTGLVPASEWALFHQIWYRWKIPFGATSLAWWYLFCLAYKRTADLRAARDLSAQWIERLDIADVRDRAMLCAQFAGVSTEAGIVAMRHDVSSLSCFAAAAIQALPLITVSSERELAELMRESRAAVLSDCALPRDAAHPTLQLPALPPISNDTPDIAALCLGRRPPLAGLSQEVRRFWADLPATDRTYALIHLEQRLATLEIVRFSWGNVLFDNDEIAEVLKTCRSEDPLGWSALQLCFASAAWAWQEVGFVIQELNQAEVSLPLLRVFIERRIGEYERIAGRHVAPTLGFVDAVRQFAALRPVVERTHQRCLYFDGGNWERREFLLRKAECLAAQAITTNLRSFMRDRFGVPFPEAEPSAAWKQYLGTLLEHSRTATDLMIALAEWAANTDDLPVDYAIFDVPMGVKLERPWEIELEEVFCYTAFRSGFEPKKAGVPLNSIGVQNAIGQRMRYNAVKKAQNYALVKRMSPQSFLLPDISIAEDAHHGGHYYSGVRHACRVPISVNWRGSEWKGIADVRLSRADYSEKSRFREADLLIATRYGVWSKAIADEAYARGLLFDRYYCTNLDDGRNMAAKLGRA